MSKKGYFTTMLTFEHFTTLEIGELGKMFTKMFSFSEDLTHLIQVNTFF